MSLLSSYAAALALIPSDVQNTCGAVLFACLESVSVHLGSSAASSGGGRDEPSHYPDNQAMSNEGLLTVPVAEDGATFSSLILRNENQHVASEVRNDVTLPEQDDALTFRAAHFMGADHDINRGQQKSEPLVLAILEFERRALVRRQIARLSGPGGFPSSSALPFDGRTIDETEMLTFSPLCAGDFRRSRQLLEANKFMLGYMPPPPLFTNLTHSGAASGADGDQGIHRRRFFRNLSALTLAQLLSRESLKEPLSLRSYLPSSDELIYVLHHPPPHRRLGRSAWSPLDCMSASQQGPPAESTRSVSTPKVSQRQGKPPMAPDWSRFRQETLSITPAGDALVMVRALDSTHMAWLSIHIANALIGLRVAEKQPQQLQMAANKACMMDMEPISNSGVEGSEEHKEFEGGEPLATAENGPPTELDVSESSETKTDERGGAEAETAATKEKKESLGKASTASSRAVFFCQTEDGVRIVACAGPTPEPPLKPDGLGTICLMATMPSGLCLTACSNGSIRVSSAVEGLLHPGGRRDPLGEEMGRYIAAGGTVVRSLGHGPYSKDLLSPDGTRTLFNRTPGDPFATQHLTGFHAKLLREAPPRWTYVRLCATGSVNFYNLEPGSSEPAEGGQAHPSLRNISSSSTDAESKARVVSYLDGRVLVLHRDSLREATFPDGTTIQSGGAAVVFVSKAGLPSVEVDLDIDRMSFRHAQGLQVPIAKGGERVRARIALPDGTALLIKYDTRITSVTNGSLKLVRRDRSVIVALDNGQVDYFPSSAWTAQSADTFRLESEDGWAPPEVAQLGPGRGSASSLGRTVHGGKGAMLESQSVAFAQDSVALGQMVGGRSLVGANTSNSTQLQLKPAMPTASKLVSAVGAPVDLQTSYRVNILSSTCRIEDSEFNCFELSLSSPLQPQVRLAGEVEGLTPTAVTATPLDPRVFLVNRDAAACEVLSSRQVDAAFQASQHCPDAVQFAAPIPTQASERPGSTVHTLFTQRRTGRDADLLSFGQIFSPRPWQGRKRPATASLVLRRTGSVVPNSATRPRVFETLVLTERSPLSASEYAELESDVERWRAFQQHRLVDMDRFTVGDPRPPAELEEEERLVARLRLAYKQAKAAATRSREKTKTNTTTSSSSAAEGYQSQRPAALHLEAASTIDEGSEYQDADDVEVGWRS